MPNDYYPPGVEVPEAVQKDDRDFIPGPTGPAVEETPEVVVETVEEVINPEPVVDEPKTEEDVDLDAIREEALKTTDPEYVPEPPKKTKKGKNK